LRVGLAPIARITDPVLGVVTVLGIVGIHALVERKPKWFDYTDSTTWELIKKGEKK
jgi:hypothetical protein